MTDPRVVAVIQARMGSLRLPGKVLEPLDGEPVLGWVLNAVSRSCQTSHIVVATTYRADDDRVADFARAHGINVVRGPTSDVLARYVLAAREFEAEYIIRVTGDCPFLDPSIIDSCAALIQATEKLDYASCLTPRSFPRGLDVEVLRFRTLMAVDSEAQGYQREHVTSYILENSKRFSSLGVTRPQDASRFRVTVDTPDDLALATIIAKELGQQAHEADSLIDFLESNPEIARMNHHVQQRPSVRNSEATTSP